MDERYPFRTNKIPVINSVATLDHFIKRYPNFKFCLYLAFKNDTDWEKSTSRVYMNQVLPKFLYVPVNIDKGDYDSLRKVYQYATENPQIVAINQTQPHKSNPVLMDVFMDLPNMPTNIDALIKNEVGELVPYDLNGPSFVGWFSENVTSFSGKTVFILGVGGVGEPIARAIMRPDIAELFLVDPVNKQYLAAELSVLGEVRYKELLDAIGFKSSNSQIILINAAGKEGIADDSGIDRFLMKYRDRGHIFIDLRPQLNLENVDKAQKLGWQAFTGCGMNARNDYTLLESIASVAGISIPSFDRFKELVKQAS